jgi:hypothetical protein
MRVCHPHHGDGDGDGDGDGGLWKQQKVTPQIISEADQKRLVRWRFVETVESSTPNFQGGTKETYSDINLMLIMFLRATKKL